MLALSNMPPLLIEFLLLKFSLLLLEVELELLKTLFVVTLKLRLTSSSLMEKVALAALDVCKRVLW